MFTRSHKKVHQGNKDCIEYVKTYGKLKEDLENPQPVIEVDLKIINEFKNKYFMKAVSNALSTSYNQQWFNEMVYYNIYSYSSKCLKRIKSKSNQEI